MWYVDNQLPLLTIAVAPPASSPAPASTALFVLRCNAEITTTFQYQRRLVVNGLVPPPMDDQWTTTYRSAFSFTDLVPGAEYVVDVRGVSATGVEGSSVSWRWSSGACANATSVTIAGLTQSAIAYGERLVTWSPLDPRLAPVTAGVEYSLDDEPWVVTSDSYVVLSSLPLAVWHTLRVRAVTPTACSASTPPFSTQSLTWFESEPPPGAAAFAATPNTTTASAYAVFALNATTLPVLAEFEYSLDGSTWSGCDSGLQLGPLSSGSHTLTVRTVVSIDGEDVLAAVGGSAQFQWTVVTSSASTISLSGLADGPHSLTVVAGDPVGHVEAAPKTYTWTVDTVPPLSSALLLSPALSNVTNGTVSVACSDEQFPFLCTFCWQLMISGRQASQACSSVNGTSVNGTSTLALSVPGDGVVVAWITAVDGAGNKGNVVSVQWVVDTTPPVTTAAISSPTFYVNVLHASAINTSYVTLAVSANEPVQRYDVVVRRLRATASTNTTGGGVASNVSLDDPSQFDATESFTFSGRLSSVSLPNDLHGNVVVAVSSVDLAGNADPTPAVLSIVTISTSPTTYFTALPDAVTNKTTVTLAVSSPNEVLGLFAGFDVVIESPSLQMREWRVNATDRSTSSTVVVSLSQSIVVDNLTESGVYHASVRAIDVLANAGAVNRTSFVVDHDAPSSSFSTTLPRYTNSSAIAVHPVCRDATSACVSYVRLDAGAWVLAASAEGNEWTGLVDGARLFEVRGVDGAGNVQPAPYDSVTTTVDTVAPIVVVEAITGTALTAPAARLLFTNNATTELCVSVNDASPCTAVVTVTDGGGVSNGGPVVVTAPRNASTFCDFTGIATVAAEGNHTVTAVATDAAGNAAVPATTWFIFDQTPPQLVSARTSMTDCVSAVVAGVDVVSCRSSSASLFSASCVPAAGDSSRAVSPCAVQWALVASLSTAGCVVDTASSGGVGALTWTELPSGVSTLNLTSRVAALVDASPTTHFSLRVRPIDRAGNVGEVTTHEWWVDVAPPPPPTVVSGPDEVGVATTATFTLKVTDGNASPGQLSLNYTLFVANRAVTLVGGNPVVPPPVPVNSAPTTVSLTGLTAGTVYSIVFGSITQSGVVSVNVTQMTWRVLATAPAVTVLSHPDASSGSRRPVFEFQAAWGDVDPAGAEGAVRFQMLLLNDVDLGQYHYPAICNATRLVSASHRDCVNSNCSATYCKYSLYLLSPGVSTRFAE